MPRIPTSVSMYHDVVDAGGADANGFPGAAAATYKVEAALFERHLDAIERRAVAPTRETAGHAVRSGCAGSSRPSPKASPAMVAAGFWAIDQPHWGGAMAPISAKMLAALKRHDLKEGHSYVTK